MILSQEPTTEQPVASLDEWRKKTDAEFEELERKLQHFEETVERRLIDQAETLEVMLECTVYLSGAIERLKVLLTPPDQRRPARREDRPL